MDVIINEVVSSIRMVDNQPVLDQRTLGQIVNAVLHAVDDRDRRKAHRAEEAHIEDDGRGGLSWQGR